MPYFTEVVSEIDSEADFDCLRYQIGVDSTIKK